MVHLSTTTTLTRFGGTDGSLPPGDLELPYSASKIASERIARELQDSGAPSQLYALVSVTKSRGRRSDIPLVRPKDAAGLGVFWFRTSKVNRDAVSFWSAVSMRDRLTGR